MILCDFCGLNDIIDIMFGDDYATPETKILLGMMLSKIPGI